MRPGIRRNASRLAAAAAGAVTVAAPAAAVPAPAYPITVIGLLAVLAAAVPAGSAAPAIAGSRWPWAGTVATATAIVQCSIGTLTPAALAAEGLLILCYLLLLDLPGPMPVRAARRWVAGQVPVVLAACAVAGAVIAALALPQVASPWLALAGLAAAAAAYLIAVPEGRGS